MADPVFVHQSARRDGGSPIAPRGPGLHAIVPQTLEEAYRLAKAVVLARLAPKGLDTPEACLVAILHGLEVGLKPMHALQSLALIQGRPVLWGDGALALVRASGLLHAIEETHSADATIGLTAMCRVQRRGERKAVARIFSRADAERAGLWGKPGPWTLYPHRMLQMRARAFALRDVFPDVLGGLAVREEWEDATVPPAGVSTQASDASDVSDASELQHADDAHPADAPFDWDGWHMRLTSARSDAELQFALQNFDAACAHFTTRADILRAQRVKARAIEIVSAQAGAAGSA